MKNFSIICLLTLLLTGCATDEKKPTLADGSQVTPPSPSRLASIEVIRGNPKMKYQVVGFVSGESARIAGEDAMIEKMREEAALMGADAIWFRPAIHSQSSLVTDPSVKSQGSPSGTALAIKWK